MLSGASEHHTERIEELAGELVKTVGDAKTQLKQEREAVLVEFEAARLRLHTDYSQKLLDADKELQELARQRAELYESVARHNDVVTLNVGGRLITVKRETLRVCEQSFLADLFTGRWEGSLQKDVDGNLFLDFDPAIFELLLNWLRDKKIETPGRPAALPNIAPEDLRHFQALADYLGLRPYLDMSGSIGGLSEDGWLAFNSRPATVVECDDEVQPTDPPPDAQGGFLGAAGSFIASFRRDATAVPAAAARGAEAEAVSSDDEGGEEQLPPPRRPPPSAEQSRPAMLPPLSAQAPAAAPAITEAPAGRSPSPTNTEQAVNPPPAGAAAAPRFASSSSSSSAWNGADGSAAAPEIAAKTRSGAVLTPKKRVGWSQRFAHPAAQCPSDTPWIVAVGDTRAQAMSGAVRATRGYQTGVHYWEVEVLNLSDWSYVGLVAAEWNSFHTPVGRSPHSWGLAADGTVYSGQVELRKLSVGYGENTSVGFLLHLSPEQRTASIFVGGKRFDDVFTDLPETVYPAVSNMRSPAKYSLTCDIEPPVARPGAAYGSFAPQT